MLKKSKLIIGVKFFVFVKPISETIFKKSKFSMNTLINKNNIILISLTELTFDLKFSTAGINWN